jgi:hypothetical protein
MCVHAARMQPHPNIRSKAIFVLRSFKAAKMMRRLNFHISLVPLNIT